MKFALFLFTISFLSTVLYAQVNTEKYRSPQNKHGVAGFISISGDIQTGNTDKIEGNLDGGIDWKIENITTFFILESEHQWIDGTRFSNKGLFHIRNVIALTNIISSEVFGQINYDKNILIAKRALIGGGIRYKLIDFKESDITIGSAYMFEHEKYDLPANALHEKKASVSRWSNYLSAFIKINSILTFGGVIYFQPMFSNFSDHRILNESNLDAALSNDFSLSIDFRLRYDSKPPDGIKGTDTKTSIGIKYQF
ncbi:MAG: DUF481 domain-containing protein [Ignavibacteriae bacterium]|nr:DUF481 domain-containing protein [Ignavibacteriota bacterium]NOG99165.1 DUF481 domain-containing protein [Ignavibacteriota bacterium]